MLYHYLIQTGYYQNKHNYTITLVNKVNLRYIDVNRFKKNKKEGRYNFKLHRSKMPAL